jgi:hypothetical protein
MVEGQLALSREEAVERETEYVIPAKAGIQESKNRMPVGAT